MTHISDQLANMKDNSANLSPKEKDLLSQVLEELSRIDRFFEIYKESTALFLKFKYDPKSNEWQERLNLWDESTQADVLIATQNDLIDIVSQCSSSDVSEKSFSIYIDTYIEKIEIYSEDDPDFLAFWYGYIATICEKLEKKQSLKFFSGKLLNILKSKPQDS